MTGKCILVAEHSGLGAGLVEAGGLLFTSGCDGHRQLATQEIDPRLEDDVEAQCANAYAAIAALLRQAGLGLESVARLDHFTRSQDWLPRRQTVRGRLFGKPAPLTSTGVAARTAGINLLTAAGVAVRNPDDKQVVVGGPEFGMENISSAVRAGPFIFVSGLRAAAAGPALYDQARASYDKLVQILHRCGSSTDRIVRLEVFLRQGADDGVQRRARESAFAQTDSADLSIGLVLGGRGDIEITAVTLAPGQGEKQTVREPGRSEVAAVLGGGFIFVNACHGSNLHKALDQLAHKLRLAGVDFDAVVRLDIYDHESSGDDAARLALQTYFSSGLPAVVAAGADARSNGGVTLCAIAVAPFADRGHLRLREDKGR